MIPLTQDDFDKFVSNDFASLAKLVYGINTRLGRVEGKLSVVLPLLIGIAIAVFTLVISVIAK